MFVNLMFNRYLRKYFRNILNSDRNTLIIKHTLDSKSKTLYNYRLLEDEDDGGITNPK
jgi:hypothetical protein